MQTLLDVKPVRGAGVVAVVDPVSSGRRLARDLRKRGVRVIEIRTAPEYPPVFAGTYDRTLFCDTIGWQADLGVKPLAERRRRAGVRVVLAGADSAKIRAEELNAELGHRENDLALLPARGDKWLQAEAWRRQGIAVIPQKACR